MDGNANGKEVIVRKETLVGASRWKQRRVICSGRQIQKKSIVLRLFPGVAIQDKMRSPRGWFRKVPSVRRCRSEQRDMMFWSRQEEEMPGASNRGENMSRSLRHFWLPGLWEVRSLGAQLKSLSLRRESHHTSTGCLGAGYGPIVFLGRRQWIEKTNSC